MRVVYVGEKRQIKKKQQVTTAMFTLLSLFGLCGSSEFSPARGMAMVVTTTILLLILILYLYYIISYHEISVQ